MPADRLELETFICADPPAMVYDKLRHKRVHRREWELEVQAWLHRRAARLRLAPPDHLDLGRDEVGIAAAAHYSIQRQERVCIVRAIGVAVRARGTGVGDAAITRMVLATALMPVDAIAGRVHPKNAPCTRLLERHGFRFLRNDSEGYQIWSRAAVARREPVTVI